MYGTTARCSLELIDLSGQLRFPFTDSHSPHTEGSHVPHAMEMLSGSEKSFCSPATSYDDVRYGQCEVGQNDVARKAASQVVYRLQWRTHGAEQESEVKCLLVTYANSTTLS